MGGMDVAKQFAALGVAILVTALLAFLTLVLGPKHQVMPGEIPLTEMPDGAAWLLGLANGAFILVPYRLLGGFGSWFARRLDLPGVQRPRARGRAWVFTSLVIGVALGAAMTAMDALFRAISGAGALSPPDLPWSLTSGMGSFLAAQPE